MDPISNMLTSIRNAQAVSHQTVDLPFSILKYKILKIFEKREFIEKVEKKSLKNKKILRIFLKYNNGKPAISGIRRISKPGQRIYVSTKKIRKVKSGYGLSIISTSKGTGLMTDREAGEQKVGGEIICEIW
jgi:small subunit ribosomal protein S8